MRNNNRDNFAEVSGVTVQKDRFPFPDTGFAEIPDDDVCSLFRQIKKQYKC